MVLSSMTCIQLGMAASTSLLHQIGPLGVAWLRLAWAGALLLVVVRPRPSDFSRSSLVACLALGAVTAGQTIAFLAALGRLPLGTVSALDFLGPLGVAVARGRGVTRLWALPAALGVLWLTEPWRGAVDPVGVACGLASGVCWAGYILLAQRVGDQVTGLRGLSVAMPVAGLVATAAIGMAGLDLGGLHVAGPHTFGQLTWPIAAAGLGLAVLSPVIPYALELIALRRLDAASFGVLMSAEPAIAMVVGLVGLNQVPGMGAVAGIVFVVVAGVGAERTGARSGPAERPSASFADGRP